MSDITEAKTTAIMKRMEEMGLVLSEEHYKMLWQILFDLNKGIEDLYKCRMKKT